MAPDSVCAGGIIGAGTDAVSGVGLVAGDVRKSEDLDSEGRGENFCSGAISNRPGL